MKKSLITGIGLLLPLFITVWILTLIFQIVLSPFLALSHYLIIQLEINFPELSSKNIHSILYFLSPFFVVGSITLLITFFGLLMRLYFFNRLTFYFQKLFVKIPIVGKIHRFSRDTLKTIFESEEKLFDGAVLVSFPIKSEYCIGLKLKQTCLPFQQVMKQKFTAVLILTAPHPIAGYLIYYPENKLKAIDMSIESIIRYNISMGAIFK